MRQMSNYQFCFDEYLRAIECILASATTKVVLQYTESTERLSKQSAAIRYAPRNLMLKSLTINTPVVLAAAHNDECTSLLFK